MQRSLNVSAERVDVIDRDSARALWLLAFETQLVTNGCAREAIEQVDARILAFDTKSKPSPVNI